MTRHTGDEVAGPGQGVGAPVGEIRTSVTVGGDVSGQLAVGSHIVQMRVDTVLGNLVTVLPPDARANVTPRPVPISLVPRRPAFLVGRQRETALAVEALSTRRPVELYGPAGMGKSTLLRSLAHQLPIAEACGGMAHLSARGLSHDDLLQVLFDVFYSSDIPVRPTPGELRHYLQHARAALLLDDVALVQDDVADVEDYAPECGFILTTTSGTEAGDALSIELTGLQGAAARALVARALGRPVGPDEQPAVDRLCGLVRGAPAGLLRLAAAARTSGGTLAEFAESAVASGVPPIPVDSVEDLRLLALLAAIPGVQLGVEELSAITGDGDVQERVDRLVARGLVLASAPPVPTRARIAYSLADGVDLGPPLLWQMEQRRAEVRQYFLDLAERRSETLLAPGAPAETLRAVHADAARHREWRYVLALGVLLDAAYALSGRWDAWREVAQHKLTAARELGDRAAEAMALHQLGTRALCVGETGTARDLLQAALRLRAAVGAYAAAQVTQHNLSLLMVPPPLPDERDDSTAVEDDGASTAVEDGHGSTAVEDDHGILEFAEESASVGAQGHAGATAVHSSSGLGVGGGPTTISAKVLAIGASLVVVPALVAGLVILGSQPDDAATVALDERALSFGAAAVNQASESRSLTARNLGATPIHLDDFRTSGPNHSDFVVTASTCRNREIAAGQTCTADVVFSPTGAGPRAASMTVDVRELDDDPTATLSGTSTEPDPSSPTAVPTELSFGDQTLNESSGRRQVTVSGPPEVPVVLGPVALSGLDAADFVVEGDSCSGVQLLPGATCSVGVRFTPADEGSRQGLLTLPGPDGVPAIAVPVNGTGVDPPSDPAFQVDPRAVDFGARPVGSPSPPERVVLANSGDAPLDVSTVSVLGSPDFALTQAACPASLEPGQDCVVTVVFAPVTTGLRTAQLFFGGDGPAVPLSGSGTAPPTAAPDISPRVLDFSQVRVGDLSPPRDVVVTNRADRPLQLTAGAATGVAGAFRLDGAECAGAAVAPGGSCTVTVRFAPTAAGEHSGVLLLTAEGFPDAAVVLSGVGVRRDTPLVPDVIGLPLAQAEERLDAADLEVGAIGRVAHPDIPEGAVADQSPRPGVPVAAGSSVDLLVSSGPELVPVPDVVGLSRSEAAQLLLDVDLRVGAVSERPDPSVETGVVLETGPPAGTQVAAGSDVDLVVSVADPPPCTVPELVGMSQRDAVGALGAAELSVGQVTQRPDPSLEAGTVLESSPAAGSRLECGSSVDLVVASTVTPQLCTVPQVVGMTRDQAAAEIRDARLTVGDGGTEASSTVGEGTVLRSSPAAGATPECGSTVTIVVSSGPPPCPEGQERATPSSPCEPITVECTEPQVLDPETNTCVTPPCPEGQERATPSSPCEPIEVECTEPQVLDPETNTCVTPPCPEGQERATPSSPCEPIEVECTEPQVLDPETNTCVTPPCPEGQVRDSSGECVLPPCPEGQVRDSSGECVLPPCPEGQVRDSSGECVPPPCPEGQVRDSSGECVPPPCPEGQVRETPTSPCEPTSFVEGPGVGLRQSTAATPRRPVGRRGGRVLGPSRFLAARRAEPASSRTGLPVPLHTQFPKHAESRRRGRRALS